MRTTDTNRTHDDHATGGFVLWIMVYAIIMIGLFAFQDGGSFMPSLMPEVGAR